jgi:hypothetical protein
MLLFFVLFLFTNSVLAEEPVWDSRQWHTLLHYKKTLFGTVSEADGPLFFLSAEGKTNPELEFKASEQAFAEPAAKDLNKHAICRFPARFEFVKKYSKLSFPKLKCSELEWWLKSIKAKSISLIYSSAFANNPASIFGHTLFRLNSSDQENISDYSINFAAITSGQGGFIYAVKGMFGGYRGMYSLTPYYQQINKYSHSESRDIWEYDLKLTQQEVRYLLLHLWEMANSTFFDYYFMDENCSYQLLTLIEAVKPNWYLSHGFVFYALPTDTLKRLESAEAIRSHRFRPSFKKQMKAYFDTLNKSQKIQFQDFIDKKIQLESIRELPTIDALISYFRYRN